MLWYYARNGQRMGPVEEAEILRLAETGQLAGTDLVWKPGLPEWRPAGQTPELASFFRPAAPPPPPPPPPPAAYSPYAPPAAPLVQSPAWPAPMFGTVTAVEYASFGARFGALVIDQIIVVCLSGILGVVGGLIMVAADGGTPTGEELIWNLLGILITWIYYAGLESSPQMATLGKRVLGLKVTDLQGQRIDFGRATGRHFGKILSGLLLGIGFLVMIWDEKNQTLHDKMSGCLVVRG